MKPTKHYSSRGSAFGFSLAFHAVFLLMLSWILFTNPVQIPETEITLEIEEDSSVMKKLRYKPDLNSKIGELSNQNKNAIQKAAKKVGVNSKENQKLVAEANVNKETIMLASLSSVVELRENLRFALKEVVVDSSGAFMPIHAAGPETDFLMDGVQNGFGSGSRTGLRVRFGGRNGRPRCPAFTPIDTSYVIDTDSTVVTYE